MSYQPNAESGKPAAPRPPALDPRPSTLDRIFALAFGLVLGLALVKFGNPVILDQRIDAPSSLAEAWTNPWPTHWANWLLAAIAIVGAGLAVLGGPRWTPARRLWVLPLAWFAWQLISATQSLDRALSGLSLWHFAGCLACYFLGGLVIGAPETSPAHEHARAGKLAESGTPASTGAFCFLLIGILAALAFCLVRAANQRVFEFPAERQMLLEGERVGWTNFPPDVLRQLRHDGVVLSTNGLEVANPIFLEKLGKARVFGTLVYPNALAGALLLLGPLAIALAVTRTRRLRPTLRAAVIAITLALTCADLYWTGSKSGWLLALALAGVYLLHLDWPARWKWTVVVVAVLLGLAVFAFRFHDYFARGATSVGARIDYWRVALRVIDEHPWLGTGPGAFQRPYAQMKSQEAEMTRLVHNDYLEQFADSGVLGGLCYTVWISLALVRLGRRLWSSRSNPAFAVFVGLLGWFAQGLSEFGLYVPALAWTAFTLLGCSLASSANRFDTAAPVD